MPSHRSPTRLSKSSGSKARKSPDRERSSRKAKHHRSHGDSDDYHHSRDSHRRHESSREKPTTSSSSNRKSESFASSSSRKRQYSGDESPERQDESKRSRVRIKEEKGDGREVTSRKGDSHRDSPKVKEEPSTSKSDPKSLSDLIEDEDAASWVMKSRKIEEERLKIEKMKAERKARMLDEMDDEIVSQVGDRRSKNINEIYSEKDLSGLQVAHSEKYLKEGQQFIMTLKDKDVLDENDDVLENVNLVDIEKAEKNMKNKLKADEYRPYDEPEYDEFGILKKKNILAKYDEELDGFKRDTFQIGTSSLDREKETEMIRERLRQQAGVISLETPSFKVASEYYTEEEMAKFKKPKKIRVKKTKGKRKTFSESIIAHDSSADHGSRTSRITMSGTQESDEMSPSTSTRSTTTPTIDASTLKMEIPDEDEQSESDSELPGVDLSGVMLEEQEAEEEFRRALEKAKRLKEKDAEKKAEEERIAKLIAEREAIIKKEQEDELDLPSTSTGHRSAIVLNATAEFCRNLGDISTIKEEDEDEDDLMDFEKDALDDRKHQADISHEKVPEEPTRGTWNEVDMEASVASFDSNDGADPSQPILEEEPDVSLGVAAALKVAMKKGYLDKEPRKPIPGSRGSSLQAQNYTIEEKFYDEDKMGRRGDRYNGPLSEFKEKDGYKPDVKLDYVDEKGRTLNQKEAFRVLSHKFHGKGPGKNKIDKRMKKLDQGEKLRQMHSTDTPLGTLKLLQDKQKELHTPYVVLSGASTSLTKK